MKISVILPVFLLLMWTNVSCQQSKGTSLESRMDSLFGHIDEASPGYMISVSEGANTIFKKGYGLSNLEQNVSINEYSAFNIASLSKQFTAAAIALLILDEKLDLEDDVKSFFPNANFEKGQMKLKHLIYMTSGINDYYYNARTNGSDWSSLNFFSIDTAISASFSAPLMYEPGSQWSYSNINYMLLTKIVEQVSKVSFAEFVEHRIFEPLGMTNSFVNDDIFQVIPNRALGYNHRDQENTDWLITDGYLKSKSEGFLQINRNSPHYGGSGVYTTMMDFNKWMSNFRTKEFGGEEFYNLMHRTMKFDHDKANDAFGLVHGDYNGKKTIWYEGGDWGFSSYFIRFPDEDISITCFSNLGTGNARDYTYRIIDILLEHKVIKQD